MCVCVCACVRVCNIQRVCVRVYYIQRGCVCARCRVGKSGNPTHAEVIRQHNADFEREAVLMGHPHLFIRQSILHACPSDAGGLPPIERAHGASQGGAKSKKIEAYDRFVHPPQVIRVPKCCTHGSVCCACAQRPGLPQAPASSLASHCKRGKALTSPALHARGCASPSRAR